MHETWQQLGMDITHYNNCYFSTLISCHLIQFSIWQPLLQYDTANLIQQLESMFFECGSQPNSWLIMKLPCAVSNSDSLWVNVVFDSNHAACTNCLEMLLWAGVSLDSKTDCCAEELPYHGSHMLVQCHTQG